MDNISLITTLFFVFAAAIIGAIAAKKFSVPMLLGYIAIGIAFGNLFPAYIDQTFLNTIAEVGITLLLFTLGVECSFHRMSQTVKTIAASAVLQILLTTLGFLLLFIFLHMEFLPSLFLSVAIALSSTAVVVKILSERGELSTIPGEVLTAWLVVQDLCVVPIMVILPAIASLPSAQGAPAMMGLLALSIAKSAVFLGSILLLGRIVPKILGTIAALGSREIFLITIVAIVFFAGSVSFAFGLSAALGAFIAGLLLSETSQNHAVFSEIRPLRDVFSVIFFVTIGMALPLVGLVQQLPLLIFLTVVVLGVKWAVVMGLMRFLGFHRKTAFLVALGLLPMSEFGFIIARTGLSLKAITSDQYVFLVALTFLTIFAGSPMIARGQKLFYRFQKTIGTYVPNLFPLKDERSPDQVQLTHHVVICGYGRVGKYIGRALAMADVPFLVVDYNHATANAIKDKGIAMVYGDPADPDVLKAAGVGAAETIIIAIPDKHTQELVIMGAQTMNKHIHIICRTHFEEDQPRLKSLGVATIVQPEFEAALAIVERLLPQFGVSSEDLPGKIARLKIEHGVG